MLWKYSVHMYVNGKMRPTETIRGIERGWIKRMMEGGNSTMIYCKDFCECHNAPSV
jgi:hypothetical protein